MIPKHLIKPWRFLLFLLVSCSAINSPLLARPDHVVLGYVPDWRDAVASPKDFNYDAFTHLARAFLRPQLDGSLTAGPDYFNAVFEKAARDHGVKLLMSIGGESSSPEKWLSIARDSQHKKTFLDSLAQLFDQRHYDGIDIDFEPPPQTDADGRAYAALLQSIRERFPNCILTIALSASNYGVGHLPLEDVFRNIDYMNVMTYDYSGAWTGVATLGANLHGDAHGSAHTRTSVEEGMRNLIEAHHVPPAKLLLGMTFWGYRFRVDQMGDSFPAHAKGFADNIEFPRVIDLLNTGRYAGFRDAAADTSLLVRTNGGCVVTYDDPGSIQDKCDLARSLNCAGVMIWHVGADLGAGETPLLDAVAKSFGATPLGISQPALEREIVRLSHHPIPPATTLELLLKADAQLRLNRGNADDARWAASKPAATQPATTRASTQKADQ